MELFERVKKNIGGKQEKSIQPITADSFEGFRQILEKESAGVVCVNPWRIVRQGESSDKVYEYGLDYYSQGLNGKDIFFQERFGRFPTTDDLQLKNLVTAISRTQIIHDLLKIDSYVTTRSGFMADALDPEGYPKLVEAAKNKGFEPFPLPIPKAIIESFD